MITGSPADKAGIKVGDILVSIDGRWTTTPSDTIAAAVGVKANQATKAVVIRDGTELALTVVPKDGI